MNASRCFILLGFLCFTISLSNPAFAQGTSARDAVNAVTNQFGPRSTQWIAELRGRGGVPQPREWDIVAFDDRAPGLLYRFRSGYGRAQDMGIEQTRYPMSVPVGYFSFNQLGVDSVAAFTIAEGEARKAKMAFDSCDYLLRVREFSTEPLWRLELLDTSQRIVGKIYIAGSNGRVLRTIWFYYDQNSRRGQPQIIDSAAPTAPTTPLRGPEISGITGDPYPPAEPRPGADTGIVRMPPGYPGSPGDSVSPTVPPTSPPRMTRPGTTTAPSSSAPQPYRPVSPEGSVVDNSIPEPPAVSNSTGMRDLREDPPASDPTAPPIEVPSSSAGSSERIPPPPIP
ncbi:MAG: hypothetical protein AAGC68_00095 [Verrucomicrobiota bacterium]